MEIEAIVGEMIGMLSVGGGLCVAAYAIFVGGKERRQRLEYTNKERLLLIEKGMDPALAFQKPNTRSGAPALFWGLTLAGVGLGILVGTGIVHFIGGDYENITSASGALFGGIGMVIYYLYHNKSNAQKTG